MNKKILQALVDARIADARIFLNAKRFDAAYYVARYAIEGALKACIATKTKRDDFGLKEQLKRRFHQDPASETKWVGVKDWSEKARYEVISPQREARRRATEMVNAVEDRQGILVCIQQYWQPTQ